MIGLIPTHRDVCPQAFQSAFPLIAGRQQLERLGRQVFGAGVTAFPNFVGNPTLLLSGQRDRHGANLPPQTGSSSRDSATFHD